MLFSFGVLIANQFDMILHYRKRLRFLRISFSFSPVGHRLSRNTNADQHTWKSPTCIRSNFQNKWCFTRNIYLKLCHTVFKIGPVQQSLHVCLRFDFGPFASSTLCVLSLATCTSAWVEKGPVKVGSIVLFGKNEAGTGDSEVGNHMSNHHWQVPFKKESDWSYDTPH